MCYRPVRDVDLQKKKLNVARALSLAHGLTSTVTSLNLEGTGFGNSIDGVKALASFLRDELCRVAEMNLCDCAFGPESVIVLGEALKVNTALMELNVRGNNVKAEGGKAIGEALKVNKTLTELNLVDNTLEAEAGKAISEALK